MFCLFPLCFKCGGLVTKDRVTLHDDGFFFSIASLCVSLLKKTLHSASKTMMLSPQCYWIFLKDCGFTIYINLMLDVSNKTFFFFLRFINFKPVVSTG